MISIVTPLVLQAAIIIGRAYVGALSLHPKLLRGSDREGGRVVAVPILTVFSVLEVDHPHVTIPYDVVPAFRHSFLRKSKFSTSKRAIWPFHPIDSRTTAFIRFFTLR